MSAAPWDFLLYAGAIGLLWLTPGPVWVAITARALSGGFISAWPLAIGVALGDLFWPLVAIFGLNIIEGLFGDIMQVLQWVAVIVFIGLGVQLIRTADAPIDRDGRLNRPGAWAGFLAGIAAILGNPKAVLFYLGILPGFFTLSTLNAPDITLILLISATIPMLGNLAMAALVGRVRVLLSSPAALKRLNTGSGILLILVGLVIPFT